MVTRVAIRDRTRGIRGLINFLPNAVHFRNTARLRNIINALDAAYLLLSLRTFFELTKLRFDQSLPFLWRECILLNTAHPLKAAQFVVSPKIVQRVYTFDCNRSFLDSILFLIEEQRLLDGA